MPSRCSCRLQLASLLTSVPWRSGCGCGILIICSTQRRCSDRMFGNMNTEEKGDVADILSVASLPFIYVLLMLQTSWGEMLCGIFHAAAVRTGPATGVRGRQRARRSKARL